MRSTIAFVALVGFALVNTAFLGYYLYSSNSPIGGLSTVGPNTTSTTGSLQTQVTSTITTTTAVTSASAESTVSGTTTAESTVTTGTQSATLAPVSNSTTTTSPQSLSTTSSYQAEGAVFGTAVPSGTAGSFFSGIVAFFEVHSLVLAPGSWVAVGGMWIWRGRMRSKWTDLGFDSDVFTLFVKMKGAKTRIRLLDALSVPKDRLQLAEELGLDWKSVDRHVAVMKKYGFLDDKVAYGRVRMYQLTPMGTSLLKLLQELSREEKREDTTSQMFKGEA